MSSERAASQNVCINTYNSTKHAEHQHNSLCHVSLAYVLNPCAKYRRETTHVNDGTALHVYGLFKASHRRCMKHLCHSLMV